MQLPWMKSVTYFSMVLIISSMNISSLFFNNHISFPRLNKEKTVAKNRSLHICNNIWGVAYLRKLQHPCSSVSEWGSVFAFFTQLDNRPSLANSVQHLYNQMLYYSMHWLYRILQKWTIVAFNQFSSIYILFGEDIMYCKMTKCQWYHLWIISFSQLISD